MKKKDPTKLKKMRTPAEALRDSEKRFEELADNINEVFWLANRDRSEILYVSPAYAKIWGCTCESLYENPHSWCDPLHPDDRLRVLADMGKDLEQEFKKEYRIVRPDGSDCWIRECVFPIRDEGGEIYRIGGVAVDITEEKQLRLESEYRLQQIIQADRLVALGEVVAGVAHEINNPCSFITYNVPLLKETWDIFKLILKDRAAAMHGWKQKGVDFDELMQDMEEIIEAIKVGSERINRVVENLKDFARLDESSQTRPVEVNEVVKKTLTIVGAQVRYSGNIIKLNLGETLPAIQGHFQKLEQVLANLLVNAVYAARASVKGIVSVTTRYVHRLQAVLIEVEDNGIGMEQSVMCRVFDPFFTTRRAEGGTGLGLSVSYGLVKEHNGRIGILSRPGLGSRFTVFLPVDKKVHLNLNPTILCVDDDPGVLRMLASMFLKADAGLIQTTSDSKNVPAYLEEHPEVDMVLTDIVMPGLDGWQLFAKIKSRFPLLPVILFSGYPDKLAHKPDGVVRPDYLLAKPVTFKVLMQAINSIGRMRL